MDQRLVPLREEISYVPLIEEWLERLLPSAEAHPQPLHRAMRYAVLSGGKRMRSHLVLQVAMAHGVTGPALELTLRAACAIEIVHAASLVHDDLPCIDDAAERRGQQTVHVLFGEPMAVLVGDALMALAFEVIAAAPGQVSHLGLRVVGLISRAAGSQSGLAGGQSLELEPGGMASFSPELLRRYHVMKTAALFQLACEAGAIAAGSASCAEWGMVGQLIGQWFQLADDLIDVVGSAQGAGKPIGQDLAHRRPNAVLACGPDEVLREMGHIFQDARHRVQTLLAHPAALLSFIDSFDHHLRHALISRHGWSPGSSLKAVAPG